MPSTCLRWSYPVSYFPEAGVVRVDEAVLGGVVDNEAGAADHVLDEVIDAAHVDDSIGVVGEGDHHGHLATVS